MIQSKSTLKWLFRQGERITQAKVEDLIDSTVHINDMQTVNVQQVNQRLAVYDGELKGESAGQYAVTLGDITKVFQNFPRAWNLASKLSAAVSAVVTWSNIAGKPTQLPVRWTEQILDTSNLPITGVGQGYNFGWGWLAASFGAPVGATYVIIDVYTQRKSTPANNDFTVFDGITKIKIGLNPYVTP